MVAPCNPVVAYFANKKRKAILSASSSNTLWFNSRLTILDAIVQMFVELYLSQFNGCYYIGQFSMELVLQRFCKTIAASD